MKETRINESLSLAIDNLFIDSLNMLLQVI
jgi:hypothetical protein